jgi:hypothetical protein
MRTLMWILWPSFLVAVPATGIYFSLFDPVDLDVFGVHVSANRIAAYTIGFLAFWMLAAFSSLMTLLLAREVR